MDWQAPSNTYEWETNLQQEGKENVEKENKHQALVNHRRRLSY